jgi:hypothetical protein
LVEEQGRFSEMNFCCQKCSLSFPRAQPVLPQGRTAIFVAGASVFGVFAAGCNFSHLKGEELTVIHLLRTVGLFLLLPSVKKYAKLKMPPQRVALRCCLQAQVVMLPSGKRPGGRKSLLFVPPFANAEGGMHHGVERCSAAVRHCWRHSWNYISDRMGNLQRDP